MVDLEERIIMNKNAKIYIAGHTGLVGSAIHRNLISKGYSNFVFSSFPEYDLTSQQQTADFFAKEKPEYVYVAAAKVGGIVANSTYRGQFIYENLMIQNNIIHQAYVHGVKKLLFLGSSCIYPKDCAQPMSENALLTDILEYTNEPYAIAKIAGIKMCESYNLQYGTNFISVMPTNLYGPNDNYDLEKSHVLPALIRKMYLGSCLETKNWHAINTDLNKRPVEGISGENSDTEKRAILAKYGIQGTDSITIHLWGSGIPRREFLYSEDMADACVYIMEHCDFQDLIPNDSSEIRNTHINIGTGRDLTICELAEMVKQIVGFTGTIAWDSTKPDGTFQKLLNVDKLHSLGWKENISMITGIETVFKQYIQ
jgi:GDP-L-fucose synthase